VPVALGFADTLFAVHRGEEKGKGGVWWSPLLVFVSRGTVLCIFDSSAGKRGGRGERRGEESKPWAGASSLLVFPTGERERRGGKRVCLSSASSFTFGPSYSPPPHFQRNGKGRGKRKGRGWLSPSFPVQNLSLLEGKGKEGGKSEVYLVAEVIIPAITGGRGKRGKAILSVEIRKPGANGFGGKKREKEKESAFVWKRDAAAEGKRGKKKGRTRLNAISESRKLMTREDVRREREKER